MEKHQVWVNFDGTTEKSYEFEMTFEEEDALKLEWDALMIRWQGRRS